MVRHGRASGWDAKGEGIFEIVHADGSITKGPNTNSLSARVLDAFWRIEEGEAEVRFARYPPSALRL